jgi:hypothetical protein
MAMQPHSKKRVCYYYDSKYLVMVEFIELIEFRVKLSEFDDLRKFIGTVLSYNSLRRPYFHSISTAKVLYGDSSDKDFNSARSRSS